MANYDTLTRTLQTNVKQNSNREITGGVLQTTLMSFISTLGTGSSFMGILSSSNRPTGAVDGKQFYIGFTTSTTALRIDLSGVGLGTLSIGRGNIYVVHNTNGVWQAIDVAAGLSATIPTRVTQLDGIDNFLYAPYVTELDDPGIIDKLGSNRIYFITSCTSLTIGDYGYVAGVPEVFAEMPTYIYLKCAHDFTLDVSALPTVIASNDSVFKLVEGYWYRFTVTGYFWGVSRFLEIN